MIIKPHIIEFERIGSNDLGYISIAEVKNQIHFDIKRVYWTYYTPNEVQRGFHAHKNLNQVIIAVSGEIRFKLIDVKEVEFNFTLNNPSQGLFIPKMHWREISFSHNAVLLCLASEVFLEDDYIREYYKFIKNKDEI